MGVLAWDGDTSNVLNTGGNWTTGAAPVSNDAAQFLAAYDGATYAPATSMAALTAVDLDYLYVQEGYTRDIGASGSELDISADRVDHFGSGHLWYKDGAGTTDAFTVCSSHANPSQAVCTITGATITRLAVLRGGVTVTGTVTNIDVGYKTSPSTDSKLTIGSAATVATLTQWGGVVNSSAALTTVSVVGGYLTQSTATITTLRVLGGGRVLYKFGGGTIADCILAAGAILDLSQATGQVTITNLWKHPDARIIGDSPALLSVAVQQRFDYTEVRAA